MAKALALAVAMALAQAVAEVRLVMEVVQLDVQQGMEEQFVDNVVELKQRFAYQTWSDLPASADGSSSSSISSAKWGYVGIHKICSCGAPVLRYDAVAWPNCVRVTVTYDADAGSAAIATFLVDTISIAIGAEASPAATQISGDERRPVASVANYHAEASSAVTPI